jgi:tetratricopeptide (TPR) repeat protein
MKQPRSKTKAWMKERQGRHWSRLAIALFGAVACASLVIFVSWWPNRATRTSIPEMDLRAADPKVALALRQRIDLVVEQPRSAAAWGWLGALLWAYDFRPEARQCLTQAEILEPGNPRWPYYHALSFMIATPSQAIPLLQRTVELCGNSPEAPRFRLAHLLAEQGRWEEARREFEPLILEHPQFAPAQLLAARSAQNLGELDRAVELARACTQDPRTARASLILLAALYRQQSDIAASAEALRQASNLPGDDGIDDPYQAEVTLLRGDARALCEQAHPLLGVGRIQHAAGLIDSLRRDHPDYPETWLLAGRLQFLRKDLAGGEELLRRHVDMDPDSAQGFFQLGLVLLARERFSEAAEVFGKAILLKPDFGPAHYNRGLSLARAAQIPEAIASLRESIRHNPERLESYLFLAEIHCRLGQQQPAIELLNSAQSINPSDPRLKSLRERARQLAP